MASSPSPIVLQPENKSDSPPAAAQKEKEPRLAPEDHLDGGDAPPPSKSVAIIRYSRDQLTALATLAVSLRKPEALTSQLTRDDPGNLHELKPISRADLLSLLSRDRDFMTASAEGGPHPLQRNQNRPIRRWKTEDEPGREGGDDDDGEFILSPSRKAFPSSQAGATLSDSSVASSGAATASTGGSDSRRHQNNRALVGAPPGFGGNRREGGDNRRGENTRSGNSRLPNQSRTGGSDSAVSGNMSRSRDASGRPVGPPPGFGGSRPQNTNNMRDRDNSSEPQLAPVDLGLTKEEMSKMTPQELFERERLARRQAREGPSAVTPSSSSSNVPTTSSSNSNASTNSNQVDLLAAGLAPSSMASDPLDLLFQKKLFVGGADANINSPTAGKNQVISSILAESGKSSSNNSASNSSTGGSSLLSLMGAGAAERDSASTSNMSSSAYAGSGSLLSLIAESKPTPPSGPLMWGAPSAANPLWGTASPPTSSSNVSGSSAPPTSAPPAAAVVAKTAAQPLPAPSAAKPARHVQEKEKEKPTSTPAVAPMAVPVGSTPGGGSTSTLHMLFQTAKQNPSLLGVNSANRPPMSFAEMPTADAIEGRLRQQSANPNQHNLSQPPPSSSQQQQQPPQGQFTSPALLSLLNNNSSSNNNSNSNRNPTAGGNPSAPPSAKPDFSSNKTTGRQGGGEQLPPPQHAHHMPPPQHFPYPPPQHHMPPPHAPNLSQPPLSSVPPPSAAGKMPPPNMMFPGSGGPPPPHHFYGPPQQYHPQFPPQHYMPPQQPGAPGGGGDGLARWFKMPPGAPNSNAPPPLMMMMGGKPPAAQIKSLEEIEGKFAPVSSSSEAKK